MTAPESLPTDLVAAHAIILAERAARLRAEALAAGAQAEAASAKAEAANAIADLSSTEALISHLKLEIEKLRRQLYGSRSEHKARLLEQMELQLEELEDMNAFWATEKAMPSSLFAPSRESARTL